MTEFREDYKNDPAPMASAQRLLGQYQRAVSSTYKPDVRQAVEALNELMGRARESIARLKKTGDGMFYFARVYSGDHDTAKIEAALRAQWPEVEWDVEAVPPIDGSFLEGRDKEQAGLPLYRAFVGDAEVGELKALNEAGKHKEWSIEKDNLVIGVF